MKNYVVEYKDVHQFWKTNWGGRDLVFSYVINKLPEQPINILEIGTTRNCNSIGRFSDGWSTFFWIERLIKYGGRLDIVDISKEATENVFNMIKSLSGDFKVDIYNDDGLAFLKKNNDYDLIFLDGGDDPSQTLDQFLSIDKNKTKFILCDDFTTKGKILRMIEPIFLSFVWRDSHEMALYHPDVTTFSIININ